MDISDADVEAAEERMRALLAATPHATAARYDRRVARIMVTLSNGLELAFAPHLAEGLADAKPADLAVIEISPTGLGLHWPNLDVDLYVPSLLEGIFGSKRWMARLHGKRGGEGTNSAKAAVAGENGIIGRRSRRTGAA
jgi:hypothetical protein